MPLSAWNLKIFIKNNDFLLSRNFRNVIKIRAVFILMFLLATRFVGISCFIFVIQIRPRKGKWRRNKLAIYF